MTTPRTLSFCWYAAVALGAFNGYLALTDFFRFTFEPAILLPLLLAWLAWRSSGSLTSLWLLLGGLVVFDVGLNLTPTISIRYGYDPLYALLGIAAVYMFSRPVSPEVVSGLFNRRWTRLKWLLPVALFVATHVRWWPEFELLDNIELTFKPGLAILAAVLLAGIDIRALRAAIDNHVCNSDRGWVNGARLVIVSIIVLAVLVDLDWRPDTLSFRYGFGDASTLLFAAVTVLAIRRLVDWRLLIVGLLVFFAAEWPYNWAVDAIDAFLESPEQHTATIPASGIDGLEQVQVSASNRYRGIWLRQLAIYGTSLILMATALASFAASRKLEDLLQRRTLVFVLAALGVAIVGRSLFIYSVSSLELFLLGIAAFLCGLKWQVRGLMLSPVVLLLTHFFALTLFPDLRMLLRGAPDVVTIGFYAFAFAYFGMLSNRLPGNAAGRDSSPGAGP